MSSQRSRGNRGPNRNGGDGEEVQLWQGIQEGIQTIVESVNADNDTTRSHVAQDQYIAKNSKDGDMDMDEELKKLEQQMRSGVRSGESVLANIRNIIEQTKTLRAVQKAKEDEAAAAIGTASGSRSSALAQGSSRSVSRATARERERERERDKEKEKERDKEKEKEKEKEKDRDRERDKDKDKDKDPVSLYEFDGAGDSPVPSPLGAHTRKLGGLGGAATAASDRSGTRDSVPPRSGGGDRDTPSKADSVEPPAGMSRAESNALASQRSRVNFIKGQDVAFKPKPQSSGDGSDWYLGKVQQVLGEGKSRRYKVKDEDPDLPPENRQEYRTSASSMIPVPPATADLPELDKGKTVLALYPDSTTFYKAEVMGTDADTGRVSLRFEGEENSGMLQTVDRRFVLEYRS